MEAAKPNLLIVEDDVDIADMLNAYFRVQGYTVMTVHWGEDGVRACAANPPDLVILDIRLPDIDGFEVARRLRSTRNTKDIPIIFLTEKRERNDRLRGLELHADDYITKPFDIQELRLRVRNALQRAKQGSLTHPVTGLPEGKLVQEGMDAAINQSSEKTFLLVSLRNLNRFREVYGFVASDDLLRAMALMMRDMVQELDEKDQFIGHLGPTDFILTIAPEHATAMRERIQKRLEQSFDYFYSDQHRESGVFKDQPLHVEIIERPIRASEKIALDALRSEVEGTRPSKL